MTLPCESDSNQEWRSKNLNERLAYVYTNKLFTDVTLAVEFDGKEHLFMGHKNILATYSSVLQEQFYGYESHGESYTKLQGIDPQGLAYVLKMLYHVPPSPRKDLDRSILLYAYHAAKTLSMHDSEADLKRQILNEVLNPSLVTRDDFWKILELSRILRLKDITDRLLRFAESRSKEVLRAKSLVKVSPTTLEAVLDLDMLKISEREVLDCIVRWEEANRKLPFVDEFVQDLLKCVRFRNLSSLDLCQFVAGKSDVISSDDILGIMMHLGNPEVASLPKWCSTKFRRSIMSLSKDLLAADKDEETSPNVPDSGKVSFKITRHDLLNMYFEQKYTDVCFLVGKEKKRMKAHRNVLAIGSFVFEKMFFSQLPDTRPEIEILNLDPEGFDRMLMYFYDDSNPKSFFTKSDVAEKTFNAAMKYGSVKLMSACLKCFTRVAIKPKTFWTTLGEVIKQSPNNDKTLKQHLVYASKYTKDVLTGPHFLSATLDAVRCVLELDALSIKEIEVLDNVLRWLKQNPKQKQSESSSHDLLNLIRFSSITPEEFCTVSVKHSNVLPKDEVLSILLYLHNKELQLPSWCYKGPPRQLVSLPYAFY